MIKGDIQISEPAVNLPPQFSKNLETNFSTAVNVLETRTVEKTTERSDMKNHFSRLKRRMRSRSTNIF